MSEDFEFDETQLSPMGAAVSKAIESRQDMHASMGAALDAAYELGHMARDAEIVTVFEKAIEALTAEQVVERETALALLKLMNAPIYLEDEEKSDGEEG